MQSTDTIDLPADLGTRQGCEAFELAIDIASAGALGAIGTTQLEQHVAGCESCRTYREQSRAASALVAESSSLRPTPARWQEIEANLVRYASSPWPWIRRAAVTLAMTAVTVGLIAMFVSPQPPLYIVPAVFVIAVVVMSLNGYRRLQHEMRVNDVMATYRRGLERARTLYRRLPWLYAPLALYHVVSFADDGRPLRAVVAAVFLVAAGAMLLAARRVTRELAVLS